MEYCTLGGSKMKILRRAFVTGFLISLAGATLYYFGNIFNSKILRLISALGLASAGLLSIFVRIWFESYFVQSVVLFFLSLISWILFLYITHTFYILWRVDKKIWAFILMIICLGVFIIFYLWGFVIVAGLIKRWF